jgi:hypothetical protein
MEQRIMTYALVRNDTIERVGLPPSARRLDTGAWVLGLETAPDDLKAACGYLPVAEVARPADTDTETFDFSRAVVAGKPTEVWTKRAKTADELNPPKSPEAKLDAIKAQLDQIAALPAPVLTADVVDILDDIRQEL